MITKQPFILFVVEDASGSRDQMHIFVDRTASIADIEAAAADFRSGFAAVSDARIVKQQFMFPAVEVPPPEPSAATLHAHAGVFIFRCANDEYAVVALPALNPARLMPDGLHIDQADPDIAAFVAACVAQGWSNPFGMDMLELATAYLQHRP